MDRSGGGYNPGQSLRPPATAAGTASFRGAHDDRVRDDSGKGGLAQPIVTRVRKVKAKIDSAGNRVRGSIRPGGSHRGPTVSLQLIAPQSPVGFTAGVRCGP